MKSIWSPKMELPEALETYLVETGQIHALARRQARMFSRSVSDAHLQQEAQVLLLLNLAALNRGAPRAPETFLLRPLEKKVAERHITAYKAEHPGSIPVWEAAITDPETFKEAKRILGACVRSPGRLAPLTGEAQQEEDGRRSCPLLVIGNMQKGAYIGFSRYSLAVSALEEKIRGRLKPPGRLPDVKAAKEALEGVFVTDSILEGDKTFHYRQIAAAALALRTPFLIVSGGPGTGKTWVVLQILRTLVRVFEGLAPDRIALCAPTGRAKARLGESIDKGIKILEEKAAAGAIKANPRDLNLKNLERKTLHGLLGVRPDGSMKYNAQNPLPHQVIVVDEASMVDLCLFAALLDAASEDCRILLVGDMHQLPSVEAGAVLGDLTGRFDGAGYETLTKETAGWLRKTMKDINVGEASGNGASSLELSTDGLVEKAGKLADHAIILTNSYRSAKELLAVSAYVNSGDSGNALKAVTETRANRVVWLDSGSGPGPVREWLIAHYTGETVDRAAALKDLDIDAAADPGRRDYEATRSGIKAVLDVFEGSRILTLTNNGPRGRVAINMLAEKLLRPRLSGKNPGRFFHGQPVVLGQNLHDLDLFNGDTGMVVQSGNGGLKVVFRRGDHYSVHALERLTGIEPAFAMTVHKAQGSEFDAVMLVLPEYASPLLTRQILYTGITRAKESVCILGTEEMLRTAIDTKEERPGGMDLNGK